jgi:hypothetical protein
MILLIVSGASTNEAGREEYKGSFEEDLMHGFGIYK